MQASTKNIRLAGWAIAASLAAFSSAPAQGRVVLPAGSVILVRTTTPLESSTARVGQRFETAVSEDVGVDNYSVIPPGSRIGGVVTFARAATRAQSGVIEVSFDRLRLPDGTTYTIDGKLTSTDSLERRQIESQADARVVLVGGRGGIGAAIAGAGSANSPASGILGALGTLLSQGQDVRVPAGTPLAVQLEQRLVLRGLRRVASGSATIFTEEAMVRAAQRALAQQNYYRGAIHGQLDLATRRALFEYQVDRNMTGTGNLDWRTAEALRIVPAGGVPSGGVVGGGVLSLTEAATLRRDAQVAVSRQRQTLGVSSLGRLSASRAYSEGEIELWFALSAFADNASIYEQLVRESADVEATALASRAVISAARRVDAALNLARASIAVQNAWSAVRAQLVEVDATYR